jgi:Arc/MetJ-type ribon-helix-helix transcriptional regulator
MKNQKWRNINVLEELLKQIEPLINDGKYSTIPAFVDQAIREKLAKECV